MLVRAAILKCDNVQEALASQYGTYPTMIQSTLNQHNQNMTFDVFDAQLGEFPDDISCYDLYVITGSKASVYDDEPWIRTLEKFVHGLIEANKKLFGICFGHQVIASSLGCRVSKSPKGWGVGLALAKASGSLNHFLNNEIEQGSESPQSSLRLLVSHQDQVDELTENAEILAGSEFCPHFVVTWSNHVISVQGHPEWEVGYARDLMLSRRDRIPAPVIEQALKSFESRSNSASFNAFALSFLNLS